MPKQLIGIRRLQRDARRGRAGGCSINLAQYCTGIEGIGELRAIKTICRRNAVAEAKQGRIGGAWLRARPVGIQRVLAEYPHMRRAFDRPDRRGLDLAGQVEIANAVRCDLRRGVGRPPILLKQFDRYRSGRAERVIGRTHIEMKFAGIVFVADIAIKPADIGR